MLNNKSILITGGSGVFGTHFIETVLREFPYIRRIVVYSRGEYRQMLMRERFPEADYPQLRYFIGDVRDAERLRMACEGIDVIVHAAAINRVETAEYNPDECIRTNITGSQNVIKAALECGVQDVVALSSDKACAPLTLYGATKLTADKLFVAANNISGRKDVRFSVARLSNILGSKGSAVEIFRRLAAGGAGSIPVTDKRMTRFNLKLEEASELVLFALRHHIGGEIFIPKIPSYRITDLAEAIAPGTPTVETGIRPCEKLHEEMISANDAPYTIDLGYCYAILPSISFNGKRSKEDYIKHYGAKPVGDGFRYGSDCSPLKESVESLREKISAVYD